MIGTGYTLDELDDFKYACLPSRHFSFIYMYIIGKLLRNTSLMILDDNHLGLSIQKIQARNLM